MPKKIYTKSDGRVTERSPESRQKTAKARRERHEGHGQLPDCAQVDLSPEQRDAILDRDNYGCVACREPWLNWVVWHNAGLKRKPENMIGRKVPRVNSGAGIVIYFLGDDPDDLNSFAILCGSCIRTLRAMGAKGVTRRTVAAKVAGLESDESGHVQTTEGDM